MRNRSLAIAFLSLALSGGSYPTDARSLLHGSIIKLQSESPAAARDSSRDLRRVILALIDSGDAAFGALSGAERSELHVGRAATCVTR